MLLREVLDELHRSAVCHQIQGALALMVGVVDVGPFLREEASDGGADADLGIPQKTCSVQLGRGGGGQNELEPNQMLIFVAENIWN